MASSLPRTREEGGREGGLKSQRLISLSSCICYEAQLWIYHTVQCSGQYMLRTTELRPQTAREGDSTANNSCLTGLRVKVPQVIKPDGLQLQLQLHLALSAVSVGKHKDVVEQDALVELLDVLQVHLPLLHQTPVRRIQVLRELRHHDVIANTPQWIYVYNARWIT